MTFKSVSATAVLFSASFCRARAHSIKTTPKIKANDFKRPMADRVKSTADRAFLAVVVGSLNARPLWLRCLRGRSRRRCLDLFFGD